MADLSIHPRHWPSYGKGMKVNTSKPRNANKKGHLAKAEEKLGNRRVAHTGTVKSLSSTTPETAFRVPGSMRLDKN